MHSCSRGFTLVELLVAMFITAIMMAMGYAAVNQAATGRVNVEQQAARLTEVQRAMHTLEQDFELLQPRPVRDPLGGSYLAALIAKPSSSAAGATGSTATSASSTSSASAASVTTVSSLAQQATALITLTRGGWSNPAGVNRPEEQRVSYQIEDNKLVRYYQPVLDAVGDTPLVRHELLDKVTSISFRFMDAGHAWQDTWQGSGRATRQSIRYRPVAVEITLVLKDYGTLVRVVEIAG